MMLVADQPQWGRPKRPQGRSAPEPTQPRNDPQVQAPKSATSTLPCKAQTSSALYKQNGQFQQN